MSLLLIKKIKIKIKDENEKQQNQLLDMTGIFSITERWAWSTWGTVGGGRGKDDYRHRIRW